MIIQVSNTLSKQKTCYLILKLKEKRTKKKDIDIEDELKKIIQIKTNEQLNQFSNIYLNKIKKDIVINEL